MKFSAALALTGPRFWRDAGRRSGCVSSAHQSGAASSAPANDGKLRIIVFGAHPDDAEYRGAGVAMKWAKAGHHVKLVSVHQRRHRPLGIAGGPLAHAAAEGSAGGRQGAGVDQRSARHP